MIHPQSTRQTRPTLCEFCHQTPVEAPQTTGLWAGYWYCDDCLTRPQWLPQRAFLVAWTRPDGTVVLEDQGAQA